MTSESPISEREREILRLVATGATNQQIAVALNISVNTVKVHLRNIFAKIGVESRTEATVYAIRTGIVTVREAGIATIDQAEAASLELESTETGESKAVDDIPPPPTAIPESSTSTPPALPALSTMTPPGAPEPAAIPPGAHETATDAQSTVRPVSLPAPAPFSRQRLPWLIGSITLVVIIITIFVITARPGNPPVTASPTTQPINGDQQRWFVRQSLSEPRDYFALTSYDLDRRLYVIGGQRDGTASAAVDRYDPQTDRWVKLTDKPTAVSHARAVALRGLIFVPGGEDSTGAVTDRLEIYDPREQRWYNGPALPEPRSRYALAAWEGQLYLIGGWDGTSIRDEVFVYDPVRERWDAGPPLPQPRRYAGAAVAGGRLYIVGGEGQDGPLRDSAWLEPGNDPDRRWIAKAPLPQAIARPAAIGLSSTLLIFDSERREGLTYDLVADAWIRMPLPAEAHVFTDAVLIDTNIYFVGDSRSQGMLSEYRALYVVFIPGQ